MQPFFRRLDDRSAEPRLALFEEVLELRGDLTSLRCAAGRPLARDVPSSDRIHLECGTEGQTRRRFAFETNNPLRYHAGATIEHYGGLGLDLVPGTGPLAAAVPGAFDAWMLLLRDYGTKSLADVLKYADLTPDAVDHVIVTGVHSRAAKRVARSIGARAEAMAPDLSETVGNTGSAHPWNPRSNVAQCTGTSMPPRRSRWARTASSGVMWMSGQRSE